MGTPEGSNDERNDEFISGDDYLGSQELSDNQLANIARLGNQLVDVRQKVRSLEYQLEQAKKSMNYLGETLLPEAMLAVGMAEFRLKNGFKLKVQPVLTVQLPKENVDEAEDWLEKNGHTGLMKRSIDIEIPRGISKVQMTEVYTALNELGYKYVASKGIHHMTLNKWGKEMEELGEEIPQEIFRIYRTNKTTVVE